MRQLTLMMSCLALCLTACAPTQFKTEAAEVSQLVVAFSENPKTFNAALFAERPDVFHYFTYEGLLTENGLNGELEPALAESWEVSQDNLQITFTLREGLKWSDGEPLTADDIVFTFNDIHFNSDIPANARDGLRIGEAGLFPAVTKLDDRRVQFILPEPFAPFLRTAGTTFPLPQHALAESLRQRDSEGNPLFLSTWGIDSDPRQMVCNGPYTIASYTPGERVIFERNPYYWRKDTEGNPQPYIQRVIRPIVESSDTDLAQFRSGSLDAVGIAPANYSLLKREEDRGDFTIHIGGPASGMTFLMLNLNQASRDGAPLVDPIKSRWFNTVAFRQGIAYGIDRHTMINNLYRGIGKPQYSPISVQSPYYLPPEEGLKVYDYDPDKSRELFIRAGFQYNSAGQLLDADGERVRFTLTTSSGSPTVDNIIAQIQRDLGKIGIQLDLQQVTFTTLIEKIDNSMTWEAALLAFTGGVEPNEAANLWLPDGRLHMFNLTAQAGQDPLEGHEIADWEAEIGRLYVEAAQQLNEADRQQIYAQAQQLALEYLPLIYMVNPISMAAVRNQVKGVQYSALERTMLWNIYDLKIVDN